MFLARRSRPYGLKEKNKIMQPNVVEISYDNILTNTIDNRINNSFRLFSFLELNFFGSFVKPRSDKIGYMNVHFYMAE